MRITVFLNGLGLGGTEKAAARWARGLHERGHELHVLALEEGPRRREFENHGIEVRIVPVDAGSVRDQLRSLRPDVIHAHAPGHPHKGDILGEALALLPKIPVLQTNIFGQLLNPKENAWTDFRLYISWTSCVQAARRSFQRLDDNFFCHASVAVYPLDPEDIPAEEEVKAFRDRYLVGKDEILFGRLSRPEPNKWTDLALKAFRIAARQNPKIKLLLREPPFSVQEELRKSSDCDRFIILPATNDASELKLTMASLDAVLHTSVIGESFGYGIAEPMNLGKPVIANSTPWGDQAQIELVRDSDCGFIASTPEAVAAKVILLAEDRHLRVKMGRMAQRHIRHLADPGESIDRLEETLLAVAARKPNANATTDRIKAKAVAEYLDRQQFGHTWQEKLRLRSRYYRAHLHDLRETFRHHFAGARIGMTR